jgi:hypothetical protein
MLSLAGSNNKKAASMGIASKEEIERQESFGNTHFVYEGRSHFLYMNDEYEKTRLQDELGLPHYRWFQEATGEKHWVLYNPKQYRPDKNWDGKNILKFNKDDYDGSKLETPINASSLCGLFSWITLSEDIVFGNRFYLKTIGDLSLMFAGSIIPKGFSLGNYFDTSGAKNMRYMFYKCVMSDDFTLGTKFSTQSAQNMEYMFAEMKMPNAFRLPEKFSTEKVKNMNHMFFNTEFGNGFDFGTEFIIGEEADIDSLFENCIINGEVTEMKYSRNLNYIKRALKSYNQ